MFMFLFEWLTSLLRYCSSRYQTRAGGYLQLLQTVCAFMESRNVNPTQSCPTQPNLTQPNPTQPPTQRNPTQPNKIALVSLCVGVSASQNGKISSFVGNPIAMWDAQHAWKIRHTGLQINLYILAPSEIRNSLL